MENNRISNFQLFFLVVNTQVGVGVLSLPSTVFNISGTDGWISILTSGLIVQLLLLVMWQLNRWFPKEHFYHIIQRVFGQYFGGLINVLYVLYFSTIGIVILVLLSVTVKTWAFPLTPSWIIIGCFIFICCYLVVAEIEVIARYYIVVSFIIIVFILLTLYAYTKANFLYVLPIGKEGFVAILKGSKEAVIAVLGFEFALVILSYVRGSELDKLKALTSANVFVTILYSFIAFTSYVFFSPEEIKLVPEPVLYMMKEYSFVVVERIDLLFLSLWIIGVSTTFMSYLYLATKGLSSIIRVKSGSKVVTLIAVLIFLGAIIPQNHLLIDSISEITGNLSLVFVGVIPTILLVVSFLKKKIREVQ